MSAITDSTDGTPEPDPFRDMLREGALAFGLDPDFVDAILAGQVCSHCDLGMPGSCTCGKDGKR